MSSPRVGILQHPLERGIDAQELAVDRGTIDAVGCAFDKRSEAGFGLAERFDGLPAIGDVATDDDQFFRHALGVENDAGSRFENPPRAVFVEHAVFEGLPFSGAAGFGAGFLHLSAILGMNLLKAGGVFQLGDRVAQRAFVGDAVVNAIAVHVDDGDEVGGVFSDEAEELLALEQLATDAMDLKLLEDASRDRKAGRGRSIPRRPAEA